MSFVFENPSGKTTSEAQSTTIVSPTSSFVRFIFPCSTKTTLLFSAIPPLAETCVPSKTILLLSPVNMFTIPVL